MILALKFMSFPWWWPMMAAATENSSDSISTAAATAIISAIFGGIALVVGKVWGKREEAQKRSTTIDGQPIGVELHKGPPTWQMHHDLKQRVMRAEEKMSKLESELTEQFRTILTSGHERELRIFEKIDDTARAYHARVDELLNAIRLPKRPGQ